MQSVQNQLASSWAKLLRNRNNKLQIRITEIPRCGKNNNLQQFQCQQVGPVDRKQPYLTSKGFAFYACNGSFNVEEISGAIQRSLLQPNPTIFQVSCRAFRTFRDEQAEKTRNASLINGLINKLIDTQIANKNTSESTLTQTETINKLLSVLSASEASKLKIRISELNVEVNSPPSPSASQTKLDGRISGLELATVGIPIALLAYLIGKRVFGIFGGGNEIRPEDVNVTFGDVKGVDETKSELDDVVEFLRNPEKFIQLRGQLLKGVLLVGPPGTGKTLLARALAGEAGVPFFLAAGPELNGDEMLVGQGAVRVQDLFNAAKAKSPCVIFIDEIDSVGAKRTDFELLPHENQTINQLLSEMDGLGQNEGVIVIGATNRKEALDTALLQPGRFDLQVQVPALGVSGRKDILEYYLSKVKRGNNVDVDALVRRSQGFTGSDLENMVNQAALRAAIEGAEFVEKKHLEFAHDKLTMGAERRGRKSIIPDKETHLMTAIQQAISITTRIVEKFGMSEKAVLRTVKKDGNPAIELIDKEINRIFQVSYDGANAILFKTLAKELIKDGKLDAEDVKYLLSLLSQVLPPPPHNRAVARNRQGQGKTSSRSGGSDSM